MDDITCPICGRHEYEIYKEPLDGSFRAQTVNHFRCMLALANKNKALLQRAQEAEARLTASPHYYSVIVSGNSEDSDA